MRVVRGQFWAEAQQLSFGIDQLNIHRLTNSKSINGFYIIQTI